MEIRNKAEDGVVTVELSGRLDSASAPECEEKLLPLQEGASTFILDLKELEYVSSAGLRVFLLLQKGMAARQGQMILRHVNESIRDVLDITGFTDILTIEE